MMLLQIVAASIEREVAPIVVEASPALPSEIMMLLGVMLMPLLILAIFSIVKYTVGVGIDNIDWIDFFAEMAIDMLSVFSSFIIGRIILETSPSGLLIGAFKILGFMALGVIVLCLLRRLVKKERNTSNVRMGRIRWYIVFEYGIDIICLMLMFAL